MKKHLKKFLCLSPLLLLALYWLGIYLSLRNPMEEINYSENGGWMRYVMFKPFTETISSDRIWKEDEGFQMYPYSDKIVGGQDDLSVMIFRDSSEWVYIYADDQEVEGSDFLKKLAAYGKDRAWLKNQSKKVAEQYILGTWFRNGSSRYSLKNLGDMKIKYNKLIEE